MYDNASEMYHEEIDIYFDQCIALSDNRKRKLGNKYDPINLLLKAYDYGVWFENEELINTIRKSDEEELTDKIWKSNNGDPAVLLDMSPLKVDEEVKEGKGLKILTPNKLLTKLPILAKVKAGNNSYKLKNETNTISFVSA